MTPPNTTFRPIPGDGACIVDRLRTTIPWLPPVWDKSFVVGEWRDWPRVDGYLWPTKSQPDN